MKIAKHINNYSIMILVSLLMSGFILISCGDDSYPPDTHYYLNYEGDNAYMFDYEHTDSIIYKRISPAGEIDTLVYIKTETDSGTFLEVAGMENDRQYYDIHHYIDYEYYCDKNQDQYFIRWTAKAHSSETGGSEILMKINNIYFYNDFGWFGIGDFNSVHYLPDLFTTTDVYYDLWSHNLPLKFHGLSSIGLGSGVPDSSGCKAYYNKDYGLVRLKFQDSTEVWDVIPF